MYGFRCGENNAVMQEKYQLKRYCSTAGTLPNWSNETIPAMVRDNPAGIIEEKAGNKAK